MSKIDELVEEFEDLEREDKLEVLMEYAEDLEPLPQEYELQRQAGANRLKECQTPVHMWINIENGKVQIDAYVAPEAPTVKGYVAILLSLFNGENPQDVINCPDDLLDRLGLAQILGMMRLQGLTWLLKRIKEQLA